MDMIKALTSEQLKENVPVIRIGDTIRVHNKIKEGSRERIQMFEGTVIAKHGGGISETFTVRRISYGCGVEKTFPIHSPHVEKVDIIRVGKVRRAKLYYIRDRVGKASKVKEKIYSVSFPGYKEVCSAYLFFPFIVRICRGKGGARTFGKGIGVLRAGKYLLT